MKPLSVCCATILLCMTLFWAPLSQGGERLDSLWAQGEALLEKGEVDEALEVFTAALQLDKDQARTWNYLGGARFLKADYFRALLDFKQAFALDPGDARVCNNIATAYEHLGRFEEAEGYYLRAIEIDERYAVPYRNLGILYAEHLDRPRMARTYWDKFLELSPLGPGSDTIRKALSDLDEKQEGGSGP